MPHVNRPMLPSLMRLAAGLDPRTDRCPVVVIAGDTEPSHEGESYYHTTPSGKTRVRYPNAYKWRTVYHASTRRVEVGRAWLSGVRQIVAAYHAAVEATCADLRIEVAS